MSPDPKGGCQLLHIERRPQHPEDVVQHATVIDTLHTPWLVGKPRLDHAPLEVGQVILANARAESEFGICQSRHTGWERATNGQAVRRDGDLSGRRVEAEILRCPCSKRRRCLARHAICKRDFMVKRVWAEVGIVLVIGQVLGNRSSSREEARKDLCRYLREGKLMTLLVQRVHDVAKAQKITDEREIHAFAGFLGVSERTGHNAAELANVTHVEAAYARVDWQNPAISAVLLLLWADRSRKVLIIGRGYNKGVVRKSGRFHDQIDFRLARELWKADLTSAYRFHIGEGGPNHVVDTRRLGGIDRGRRLLHLVGAILPVIGDQENAVRACQRRRQGFWPVHICGDHFVSRALVRVGLTGKGSHLELAICLEGSHHTGALMAGCTKHGDRLLVAGIHLTLFQVLPGHAHANPVILKRILHLNEIRYNSSDCGITC